MSGCVDKVASDVELADMMQTDMEMLSGEVDASRQIQNQDTGLVNVVDEGPTEDVTILDMMTIVDQAVDAFDVMVDASVVETCDPRRRSVACEAQSYCEENSNVEGFVLQVINVRCSTAAVVMRKHLIVTCKGRQVFVPKRVRLLAVNAVPMICQISQYPVLMDLSATAVSVARSVTRRRKLRVTMAVAALI